DHDVRETAALALGRIGDPRAIRPLTLTLIDDESFVRNAAYNALMDIDNSWEKSPAALGALPQIKKAMKYRGYWISQSVARLLEQDSTEAVQADAAPAALTMAERTKSPLKTPEPRPQAAFGILADLLGDRDRDLRLAAAEAFGRISDRSATSLL